MTASICDLLTNSSHHTYQYRTITTRRFPISFCHRSSLVYEIILPTQSASWKFDYDKVNSYTIVVKCLDGKPLGTASATLVVSLTPNQPPEITNLTRKNAYNDRIKPGLL
ncbi:hypothetical protein DPMN_094030 [Dreissena polymorpha]|uniref:Cadherin domain-containing protein n=1 Tax=Dreissena polymorpha TaxID=45954 RepID=A0A9D4R2A6_DREPO|nr:hypothetical protein DPMN_094030 [Dreissena polymorpha]